MLDLCDQVEFGQCRYASVNTTAATETGELYNQRGRDDFVVSAAEFSLSIRLELALRSEIDR